MSVNTLVAASFRRIRQGPASTRHRHVSPRANLVANGGLVLVNSLVLEI